MVFGECLSCWAGISLAGDAGFDIVRQRNAHTKNYEYRIAKTANL